MPDAFTPLAGPVTPMVPFPRTTEKSNTDSSTHTTTEYQTSTTELTVVHQVTDDGVGGLFGTFGTVNYAGKSVSAKLVRQDKTTKGYKSDYEDAGTFETLAKTAGEGGGDTSEGSGGGTSKKGGTYGDNAVSEEVLAASSVVVTYKTGAAIPLARAMTHTPPVVTIDLCPYTTDYIVPGSVQFTWMGTVYQDFEGYIYRDRVGADAGVLCGYLNYSSGIAQMFDYVVSGSPSNFSLDSLWTQKLLWNTASVFGRTQAAPVAPSGFTMQITGVDGTAITAAAGPDGRLTGPQIRGVIDYQTGVYQINFGAYVLDASLSAQQKLEWWYSVDDVGAVQAGKIWKPFVVDPRLLRYNSVTYFYLPLDAEVLGIDPVRLPADGRVPIFRTGGFAVVSNSKTITAVVSNGQTINCARTRLSRVRVKGANGVVIYTGYSEDLEIGTVTFTDVSGYAQPVSIEHTVEDTRKVADVQITGQVKLLGGVSHIFTAGDSYVSSALIAGDRKARVSLVFDQTTFSGVWSDGLIGDESIAQFNDAAYPILVKNDGALTERWALQFINTTTVRVIGEHVGVLGTYPIAADIAPINPATGTPYMTVPALGWGGGWSTGNALRINTIGTPFPVWAARTVQPGGETALDDSVTFVARGDVNRP